jgi:hypothetical protein
MATEQTEKRSGFKEFFKKAAAILIIGFLGIAVINSI